MKQLAILAVLFLVAGPASAIPIYVYTFADTTDSLTFLQNGVPFGTPCSTTATHERCFASIFSTLDNSQTAITGGLGNFNIYEDAGMTQLSDTLSLVEIDDAGFVGVTFDFESDVDGIPLAPLPNATSIVEDGSVQIATTVTFNNVPWDEFAFQSDVSDAPEPASLVLFGTGMVGLAGTMRRKLGRKNGTA